MALAALLFVSVDVHLQHIEQRKRVIVNGQVMASLLAAGVRIGVLSENVEYIKVPVERSLLQPYVVRVLIFSPDKQVLYDSRGRKKEGSAFGDTLIESSWPTVTFDENAESYFFIHPITSTASLPSDDSLFFETNEEPRRENIAYICVEISKDILESGHNLIVSKALIGLGSFLLLTLFLTYFIINAAIAPLRKLLDQIESITPSQKNGSDDLDILTDTYSHLIQSLEQSFATINTLREGLSEKVQARTAELRKANQKLEQTLIDLKASQMQLVQSEKMALLGQIAAGVAHEVNNGMNFINGSLEPLVKLLNHVQDNPQCDERAELSSSIDKLIANMRTGVHRVTSIVRDLTTFARPNTAEMNLVNLHHELDFALRFIQHECGDRIDIQRQYGSIRPVRCHAETINQVFLNIFLNAIHSIAANGSITIKTGLQGEYVSVSIEDTGCGIAPEIIDKVFDPFFTTKPAGKGTGLGLGISLSIVQQYNGMIHIKSVKGAGTIVEVLLPLASAA